MSFASKLFKKLFLVVLFDVFVFLLLFVVVLFRARLRLLACELASLHGWHESQCMQYAHQLRAWKTVVSSTTVAGQTKRQQQQKSWDFSFPSSCCLLVVPHTFLNYKMHGTCQQQRQTINDRKKYKEAKKSVLTNFNVQQTQIATFIKYSIKSAA